MIIVSYQKSVIKAWLIITGKPFTEGDAVAKDCKTYTVGSGVEKFYKLLRCFPVARIMQPRIGSAKAVDYLTVFIVVYSDSSAIFSGRR
jgi:hypothetical protein